jgi:hypothetical protein
MPNCLTREEVQLAQDLPREFVATPEWKADSGVYVRTMTGAERDAFEAENIVKAGDSYERNHKNVRARLAMLSVVDEAGKKLFTSEDVPWLTGKSALVLDRIWDVASRLSGLSKQAAEDAAKNSSAGQA